MGYILLLVYVCVVSAICRYYGNKNTNLELNLLFVGLFAFIAFRNPSVGTDTYGYCQNYMMRGPMSLKTIIENYSDMNEIGYLVFTKLLYVVVPFEQGLLIAQGIIVSLCYRAFVKRFAVKNYFFSVLAFMSFGLLNFHLTGIRQSIAMSIGCLVYMSFIDKKYFKAVILAMLAFLFHKSAVVLVLAFIFSEVWKKKNNILTTLCVAGVVALSADKIQTIFSTLSDRWSMYENVEKTGNGFIFAAILAIITVFVEIIKPCMDETEQKHVRVNYLCDIFWAGRLISRTFERPALYFFPSTMVLIGDIVEDDSGTFSENSHKFIVLGTFIFICAFYLYRYGSFEYSFFWQ